MSTQHYLGLLAGYSVALAAMMGVARGMPRLWPATRDPGFARPWREVGWALVAAVGVVGIGMLYAQGWLLPATSTRRPALDALNQIAIYSPFLVLLAVRRQAIETAWLPRRGIPARIGVGFGLALGALGAYAAVKAGLGAWPRLVAEVYAPGHISHLVQVLLEDIAVAILFVRFRGALGTRWTLLMVAVLFAAAHVPGMLASGAQGAALLHLVGDVALGVLALALLHRVGDVWWFWMVHFALDMTQFFA